MFEPVAGHVRPGFEHVAEQFRAHFLEGLEVGASLCVYHQGEPVVDLWGGCCDLAGEIPWTPQTLVNVYSTTKGLASIAFATIVEAGDCHYDQPVADIWPELQAAGSGLTIGDLLAHRGGLCGISRPLSLSDLYDWQKMIRLLESQEPFWPPGTASGYHAVTWGYLPGELARRLTGKTLGTILRERVCEPADADFFLGLPDSEMHRVAPLVGSNRARVTVERQSGETSTEPGPFHTAALANPVIRPFQDASSQAWQRAEIAASNGHGSARGLASAYAAVLDPDLGLVSDSTLAALLEARAGDEADLVLGRRLRRGAGVILNTDAMFGPNDRAWGHSGAGGSTAFADPVTTTAFAYAMNQMRDDEGNNTRASRLIGAYYNCL